MTNYVHSSLISIDKHQPFLYDPLNNFTVFNFIVKVQPLRHEGTKRIIF